MSTFSLKSTARITKALADPQRLRILMMLQGGEHCVCQIVEVLGLAPSTVSKHLSLLDAAGLVASRKEGRWIYYRLADGPAAEPFRLILAWLHDRLKTDSTVRQDARTLTGAARRDPIHLCRTQRQRKSPGPPHRRTP
jgi:ArsR family transcriptional regulator, arsenate/arsenite/antimonite-responsive transcriptional repressor